MKLNWKNILSVAVSEDEYFKDTTDKIEFTGVDSSKHKCLDYLPAINDLFREADHFRRIKNFHNALSSLESAYDHAGEIKEHSCLQCSMFFKATVIQSIEDIHLELSKMRRGLFATRRYDESYAKAEIILNRIRKAKPGKTLHPEIESIADLQPAYSL